MTRAYIYPSLINISNAEVLSSQGHELPGNMLKTTRACNQEHHVKIPLSQKLTRKVLWMRLTEGDLRSP